MNAETTRPQDSRLAKDIPSTAQNAALRGASLAFGKPPVIKPKPQINTYSGSNGALAAATKVGGASRPASRNASMLALEAPPDEQRLTYQRSGGSIASGYAGDLDRVQQRLSQLERGRNGLLNLPSAVHDKSPSPSLIAATLAASRSASVTPNHTGSRQLSSAGLHRQSSFTGRSPGFSPASVRSLSSSRGSSEQVLDTSSIPPTTSLIGLFEQNISSPQTTRMEPLKRSATIAAVRPRPSGEPEGRLLPARSISPLPVRSKTQKPRIKSPNPLPAEVASSSPKTIRPIKPRPVSRQPSIPAAKPIPISSRSRVPMEGEDDDNSSSAESFVSASEYQPSFRALLLEQNRRLTSTAAAPIHSSAKIDSMANAIVASSLASSRAASPSKSTSLYPPPPPPSRRNPHNHLFNHRETSHSPSPHRHIFQNSKETSHTPSPPKSNMLRTTMRKPKVEEEVDEGEKRRGKRLHLLKKHPNKHHEGDRKRWRDEITERERKRYEAVWASNKGLYTPAGSESSVSNFVARDIYSRSRLQTDVLEEVYQLVDRQQNGMLERPEFVVGLWLIDQWLKGRKLPIKVSESVWKSAGSLGMIKIKSAGK